MAAGLGSLATGTGTDAGAVLAARGPAMGTACLTAATAVAEPAEKGHHHQRLCMPAPAPAPAEGAAAAATGMALQEASTSGAPGVCPASTATGGPPAEERARDRWEGCRVEMAD